MNGHLQRVYRDVAEDDISALCIDDRYRKLFIGDRKVWGVYERGVVSNSSLFNGPYSIFDFFKTGQYYCCQLQYMCLYPAYVLT